MQGVIVGFGSMGQTHLDRYMRLGVQTPFVVEVDGEKTGTLQSSGIQVYPSLQEVPINDVDFIDICTPTYLHYSQIRQATDYDKAIFVEKPLVRTRDEANALRRLRYQKPIFVGESEHYNQQFQPFLDYSGRPLKVYAARNVNLGFFLQSAKNPWFLDEEKSGGIVLDLMIHDLNLLIHKFGRPSVNRVFSATTRYNCTDRVRAILSFGEFRADMFCSWTETTQNPIESNITIYDSSGAIIESACSDYAIRNASTDDTYYRELAAFLEAVRTGRLPYLFEGYLDALDTAFDIRDRIKSTHL